MKLPTWNECEVKRFAGRGLTPLEQFIWDEEPTGTDRSMVFRAGLIKILMADSDTKTVPADTSTEAVRQRVNDVLQDITGGRVTKPERAKLRGAVDKADAPLTGKAASDQALGKAIRFGA